MPTDKDVKAANLPVVTAIQESKNANEKSNKRLDDSVTTGLGAVSDSIKSLTFIFADIRKMTAEKNRIDSENARELANKLAAQSDSKGGGKSKGGKDGESSDGIGLVAGGLAVALGLAAGSVGAWTSGVGKATKGLTNLTLGLTKAVGKMLGITSSGKFAKITAGLDAAVKSVKGWNTKILDVLKTGAGKLAGVVSKITNSKFITTLKTFFTEVKALGSSVSKSVTTISKLGSSIKSTFSMIGGQFKAFGALFTKISGFATRWFWPISIMFAGFKAIKESLQSFTDGNILEGLKITITVLVDELFMKPFDMIKDAIAWLLGKMGFDETSDAVKNFSFSKLWSDMMDGLFNGISAAIDWVMKLFDDPIGAMKDLFNGIYGEGGIFDTIIFTPISKAIDWVMELFSWKEEDAPEFDLMKVIRDAVDSIFKWFTEVFDSIANFDFKSLIPRNFITEKLGFFDEEEPSAARAIVKPKQKFSSVQTFDGDTDDFGNLINTDAMGNTLQYERDADIRAAQMNRNSGIDFDPEEDIKEYKKFQELIDLGFTEDEIKDIRGLKARDRIRLIGRAKQGRDLGRFGKMIGLNGDGSAIDAQSKAVAQSSSAPVVISAPNNSMTDASTTVSSTSNAIMPKATAGRTKTDPTAGFGNNAQPAFN